MGKIKPELQRIADKHNIEFYEQTIRIMKQDVASEKKHLKERMYDLKSIQKKLAKLRRKK